MMSRLAFVFLFVQSSVVWVHAIPRNVIGKDSVIRASLAQLASKYNIRVHVYHHGDTSLSREKNVKGDSVARGEYSFKTISSYQSILIERFTNVLFAELNKYPVDFITNSGLKEIALVANLRVGRQRRIAMPESDTRTLYFDVNYPGARDEYCSHAIHHELFHLIYFEIHGSFYYKDPAWLALNYSSFRYKGGGGLAYGNYHAFKKQKPASGFITPYATYGVEEDMAEVFAFLMTREGFRIITYWMQVDEILNNKAQYILRLMSSQAPEFNLTYLKRIHASD
jgi:hypothetical protein